ncbi:MAG: hypothetical protein AAF541_00800 [Pseudomonadota bacterium]
MARLTRWFTLLALLGLPALVSSKDFSHLPDPTKPSTYIKKAAVDQPNKTVHQLSSIIVSPHRRVAVVNGRVVSEREEIAGAVVLKIDHGQVWLQMADNSHRTLSLHGSREGRVRKSFRQDIASSDVNEFVNDPEETNTGNSE